VVSRAGAALRSLASRCASSFGSGQLVSPTFRGSGRIGVRSSLSFFLSMLCSVSRAEPPCAAAALMPIISANMLTEMSCKSMPLVCGFAAWFGKWLMVVSAVLCRNANAAVFASFL
jgi:hypothetical protein